MQWMEVKITFAAEDLQMAVDLVADAFYSLKAKGVVIDDPFLEPEDGWAPDAVPRPAHPGVTGYLPLDAQHEDRRQTLEQAINRLAGVHFHDPVIEYRAIDEADWAESWKTYFHPQEITSRIVVKPTWRDYAAHQGQLVLEIDPGMAFGTGTHPTTSLCIQLLEKYIRAGDAVLDIGTGSGILLIAAAKLGAGRLTGIDSDAMAIDVARDNLTLNHIEMSAVELKCGDLVQMVNDTYEVVVANILAEVIIVLLDDVKAVVKPGGLFICSGIIASRQDEVVDKMSRCGIEVLELKQEEEWVAIVGCL